VFSEQYNVSSEAKKKKGEKKKLGKLTLRKAIAGSGRTR
jgi:hypothetical protein